MTALALEQLLAIYRVNPEHPLPHLPQRTEFLRRLALEREVSSQLIPSPRQNRAG